MNKYSICEFQDGNNDRWYQIKIHGKWLPSYFFGQINYSNYDVPARWREPTRYFSYEQAEKIVQNLIRDEQGQKIRLVGCQEI